MLELKNEKLPTYWSKFFWDKITNWEEKNPLDSLMI